MEKIVLFQRLPFGSLFFFFFTLMANVLSDVVVPKSKEAFSRHNFCDIYSNLFTSNASIESLDIIDILQGRNLTVGIHLSSPSFFMTVNNYTGLPTSGYIYDVLTLLSSRLGFTVEYALIKEPVSSVSWTTHLAGKARKPGVLSNVDFYGGNAFSDTTDRRQAGMGFMNSLTDASLVLVAKQQGINQLYNPFGFLDPFTSYLWGLIAVVIVCTGILNWIYHIRWIYTVKATKSIKNNNDENAHGSAGRARSDSDLSDDETTVEYDPDKDMPLLKSLYLSFESFTTLESIEPKNIPSSILNMGHCFFMLIIVASYTANLTQVLSSKAYPVYSLNSIEDAIRLKSSICVLDGSNAQAVMKTYPEIKVITVPSNLPRVLLSTLRNGMQLKNGTSLTCDGAVLQKSDWDINRVDVNANPDCNLLVVGEPIRKISGSWPYLVDFDTKCTSLIELAFSTDIVNLKADNTLAGIWQSNLDMSSTVVCDDLLDMGSNAADKLGLSDLSGVFILYVTALLVSVLSYIFSIFNERGYFDSMKDYSEKQTLAWQIYFTSYCFGRRPAYSSPTDATFDSIYDAKNETGISLEMKDVKARYKGETMHEVVYL